MNGDSEHNWAIFRRTSTADVFLGRVEAPDEQTALSIAIEKLAVTNRYHQRALVARKVEGIGLDDKPEYCD
jgi:hypothetical protein